MPPETSIPQDCPWTRKVCFLVIGVLLVSAGAFKLMAARSTASYLLPLGEAAFGTWLISGWQAALAGRAGIVVLLVFLGVLGWSALRAAPCGCFGQVPVAAWSLAAFDASALFALACQPTVGLLRAPLALRGAACTALAVTGVLVGADIASKLPGTDRRPVILISPEDDVGDNLSVLEFAEGAEALGSGEWVVVISRPGCPSCERELAELARRPQPARVAVLPRHERSS